MNLWHEMHAGGLQYIAQYLDFTATKEMQSPNILKLSLQFFPRINEVDPISID